MILLSFKKRNQVECIYTMVNIKYKVINLVNLTKFLTGAFISPTTIDLNKKILL